MLLTDLMSCLCLKLLCELYSSFYFCISLFQAFPMLILLYLFLLLRFQSLSFSFFYYYYLPLLRYNTLFLIVHFLFRVSLLVFEQRILCRSEVPWLSGTRSIVADVPVRAFALNKEMMSSWSETKPRVRISANAINTPQIRVKVSRQSPRALIRELWTFELGIRDASEWVCHESSHFVKNRSGTWFNSRDDKLFN